MFTRTKNLDKVTFLDIVDSMVAPHERAFVGANVGTALSLYAMVVNFLAIGATVSFFAFGVLFVGMAIVAVRLGKKVDKINKADKRAAEEMVSGVLESLSH